MIRSMFVSTVVFVAVATGDARADLAPSPAPAATATPQPVTGPVFGANDPCTSIGAIVTRPSQTTSVCTVRPNHVLIETGYQNTTADATSTTVQYPQALVRIGTDVPALELDLGVPEFERLTAADGTATGTTDAGAGLKYVIGYSARLNYGASVFTTVPTGAPGFGAGGSTQTYDLNFGYTLTPVFALSGTLGLESLVAAGERYGSFVPSLVLTASLPNATGLFIEAAGFTHGAGPQTPTRTQFLGGVTRALSPRFQIDLEAGRSPTSATGKYRFVGFGGSYYL